MTVETHPRALAPLPGVGHLAVAILLVLCSAHASAAGQQECNAKEADCRDDVEVSVFSGISIDTFAAKEVQKYINATSEAGKPSEQLTAGFDFAYRLAGSRSSARNIWLFGETVHGARSGEADCAGEKAKTELCRLALLDPQAVTTNTATAIFRKATTLETYVGLRAEIARLRADSPDAASVVYLKGQLGLLTVSGRGGDVIDMHHGALGVMLTRGTFMNSYVEAGYGTNQLFLDNPRRFKVDGFLSINIKDKPVAPYAQVVIDADFKDGPDTIQSYFGFDIDVIKLWK